MSTHFNVKTNKTLGLVVAAVMVLSSLGFVLGNFSPLNVEKRGVCEGTVLSYTKSVILVHDEGAIRDYDPLLEENLLRDEKLFWIDGEVNVSVGETSITLPALLFPNHKRGDKVVLSCDVLIRGGDVLRAQLIEIPA